MAQKYMNRRKSAANLNVSIRTGLQRQRSNSYGGPEFEGSSPVPHTAHSSDESINRKVLSGKEELFKILYGTRRLSLSVPELLKSTEPIVRVRSSSHETPLTLSRSFGLTPEQQKLVRDSWRKLTKSSYALALMERVFAKMCATNREINTVFVHSACMKGMDKGESWMASKNDHAKLLFCLVGDIVAGLDKNGKEVLESLKDIGEKHKPLKQMGFELSYWEEFGEVFVELISSHETMRKHHDLSRAWIGLTAAIVDNMSAGFTKRTKVQQKGR